MNNDEKFYLNVVTTFVATILSMTNDVQNETDSIKIEILDFQYPIFDPWNVLAIMQIL